MCYHFLLLSDWTKGNILSVVIPPSLSPRWQNPLNAIPTSLTWQNSNLLSFDDTLLVADPTSTQPPDSNTSKSTSSVSTNSGYYFHSGVMLWINTLLLCVFVAEMYFLGSAVSKLWHYSTLCIDIFRVHYFCACRTHAFDIVWLCTLILSWNPCTMIDPNSRWVYIIIRVGDDFVVVSSRMCLHDA